jgi:hypothetical protein
MTPLEQQVYDLRAAGKTKEETWIIAGISESKLRKILATMDDPYPSPSRPWTEEEDAILLARLHLTYREVAPLLPHRAPLSVSTRMTRLRSANSLAFKRGGPPAAKPALVPVKEPIAGADRYALPVKVNRHDVTMPHLPVLDYIEQRWGV